MKIVNWMLLVSLGVLVSGCNTARGVGADLELLGRKMQGLDSNQVVVEGLPPENVVEVPTTYESNDSYQSYQTYPSAESTYQDDGQVYSAPYESDTTYTNIPDAITYPVEN